MPLKYRLAQSKEGKRKAKEWFASFLPSWCKCIEKNSFHTNRWNAGCAISPPGGQLWNYTYTRSYFGDRSYFWGNCILRMKLDSFLCSRHLSFCQKENPAFTPPSHYGSHPASESENIGEATWHKALPDLEAKSWDWQITLHCLFKGLKKIC